MKSFIKFSTMPTIPSASVILDAQMTVQIASGTSTGNNASAYMVTGGDWSSSTITWANKPAASTLLKSNISHNNLTKYTFPCVTAVKHWYTGMPNGKFQNYGVMLQYYLENTNDYNAFYSADCTTASLRPSLTITYQSTPGELTLVEGAIFTIYVDSSSAVTWKSSNTAVATVSSSGVVTGLKSGKTTVTATANGTTLHSSTIYVKLQEGVYRIKNNATSLYLGTTGATTNGTSAKLLNRSNVGSGQIQQLWKVTYLGTGYYSIRPMHKLDMGLQSTSGTVNITSIGTSDSLTNIPIAKRWSINATSNGYELLLSDSTSASMCAESSNATSGQGVKTATSQTNNTFRWSLELVKGVYLINSTTNKTYSETPTLQFELGASRTLANMNLKVIVSGAEQNSQSVSWGTTNSAVASINSSGQLTTNGRGGATITVSKSINGSTYKASYYAKVLETVYVKNFYDGTLAGDTETLAYIDDAIAFLNEVYYDDFYLNFVMDGEPVRYQNAATDLCPNGADGNCNNCGSNCTTHHKNARRIATEAYNAHFEKNHVIVLWSNSSLGIYCKENGTSHESLGSTLGVVTSVSATDLRRIPVVQILTIDYYDRPNLAKQCDEFAYMSIVLAHEISHTLGLEDRYVQAHDDTCIMQNFDESNVNGLYNSETSVFCDTCHERLQEVIVDDAYESL